MSPRAPRARLGFTLIEVMVAVAILTFMGSLLVVSLRGTLTSRELVAENSDVQRSARATMERLTREIKLAFLTSNTTAVNTYQTVFVGTDDEPADQLWFASMAHRPLYRGAQECDQTEITLWTETDPENPEYKVLLHRESQRIDQYPDQDGVVLPLAHGVERFDLKFLDGQSAEWVEEWDTRGVDTANRLPRAVKIVLVLARADVESPGDFVEHTYVTTVLLDLADPLTRSAFALGAS